MSGCKPEVEKTLLMYEQYKAGFSLDDIGVMFGVTRQSVFTRFKRRKLAMRTKPPLPFIIWNKKKYTRRKNGYYATTTNPRTYLHRDKWVFFKGEIPEGFDVHHKDEDKENNQILNFDLMTKPDHGKRHGFGGNQNTGSLGRRPVKW